MDMGSEEDAMAVKTKETLDKEGEWCASMVLYVCIYCSLHLRPAVA